MNHQRVARAGVDDKNGLKSDHGQLPKNDHRILPALCGLKL